MNLLRTLVVLVCLAAPWAVAVDTAAGPEQEAAKIMQSFSEENAQERAKTELSLKQKHTVMFLMGVPLLLLLITTFCLGLAMALFNKKVFLWHMIAAGLTLTLALVHTVVGLVWFFPF